MHKRYDNNSHFPSDYDEDRSCPTYFERFNTAHVPKSRLGKRRTIEKSSSIKRSLPNPTSNEESKNERAENNSAEPGAAHTHPITPYKTPTLKRNFGSNRFLSKTKLNQENRPNPPEELSNTPLRKDVTPLAQVKNYSNSSAQKTENNNPTLKKKNIQPSRRNIFETEPERLQTKVETTPFVSNLQIESKTDFSKFSDSQVAQISTGVSSDSSHSDLGNNSSFMTAHDIYNVDRSRLQPDTSCLKTPGKGFSVFELYASPAPIMNENEAIKKILAKTPGLNRFETFITPFKSTKQFDKEISTPFMNQPKTPGFLSVNSSLCNEKSCFETTYGDKCAKTENKLPESPSAIKKQILEGLGWELPGKSPLHSSPDIKVNIIKDERAMNNPECSSVLLTPNNSSSDTSAEIHRVDSVSTEPAKRDFSTNCFRKTPIPSTSYSKTHSVAEKSVSENSDNRNSVFSITLNDTDCTSKPTETSFQRNEVDMSIDEPDFKKPPTDINLSRSDNKSFHNSSNRDTSENNISQESSHPNRTLDSSRKLLTNDSGMCNDETELFTVQNNLEDADTPKLGTPSSQNSATLEPKKEVNLVEAAVSEDKKVEHEFLVPLPPKVHLGPSLGRPGIPNLQSNVVYVNQKPYTVINMLGRGGSSEVFQVLDIESSKLMALKFVNLAAVEDCIAKGYLNEIQVLSKLQGCPTVIRMFDSEYLPKNKILYVLMERGDTDFSKLMKDIMKTKKISLSMIIYYWTEMLSCVRDIHEKGIIHSDLKPANFLLVSGRLKLIDFGIASQLQGDMTSVLKDVTTGTFNYMSPEAIRNSGEAKGYKITYKSDIWSLGCILYVLLFGQPPFSRLTNTWDKLAAIADLNTPVAFPQSCSAPSHLLLSLWWALRKEPKERPTAEILIQLAELTPDTPETPLAYAAQTFPEYREVLEEYSKEKQLLVGNINCK